MCVSKATKRRYAENREDLIERSLRYYAENREARRAYKRRHYIENREDYREHHVKSKYGLSLEEYDAIVAGGCAICGTHEGRICLDHDHVTGENREALCEHCNMGLGKFRDSPGLLIAACEYLELHVAPQLEELAA